MFFENNFCIFVILPQSIQYLNHITSTMFLQLSSRLILQASFHINLISSYSEYAGDTISHLHLDLCRFGIITSTTQCSMSACTYTCTNVNMHIAGCR